jgi:hypothetical protein
VGAIVGLTTIGRLADIVKALLDRLTRRDSRAARLTGEPERFHAAASGHPSKITKAAG